MLTDIVVSSTSLLLYEYNTIVFKFIVCFLLTFEHAALQLLLHFYYRIKLLLASLSVLFIIIIKKSFLGAWMVESVYTPTNQPTEVK